MITSSLQRMLRLSCVVLAMSMTPAVSAAGEPAVDKDTIVFAVGRDIAMLDAQVDNTGNSDRYAWQLYDNLYTFDKQGNLQPQIATGYEVSEDGLEYRFTLRQDVVFHNGQPLTAEDVKYSFERILEPEVKSTRRPYFAGTFESATIEDDYTVVIKLSQRDVVLMNKIAAFVAIVPKEYTESLESVAAFSRAPIGAGPYKFVEHRIGQYVKFERFDDYYGEKANIKTLIFKFVPEPSSRINAMMNGEVVMADGIAPNDVARLKEVPGVDVIPVPMGSPLHVRLYANDPDSPLSDPRVRLALNYAIDVDAIIENVMHGIGKPLSTFISAYYPVGASKDLSPYGYDPAKAKELLSEAGYPNGFDTQLLSPTSYPKDVTEAIVAYWSVVGVRAQTQLLDYPAWNRLNNTHKSGPMTVMQYSNALYDPITPIQGTASKDGTWSDYYNEEVEALIAKTRDTADIEERDALFQEIGRILREDGHSVLISELYQVFTKNENIEWTPQLGYAFYDLRTVRWK